MPASNSEARKRHEANAATVDAMAEALSTPKPAAATDFYEFLRGSSVHWVEPHAPEDYQ